MVSMYRAVPEKVVAEVDQPTTALLVPDQEKRPSTRARETVCVISEVPKQVVNLYLRPGMREFKLWATAKLIGCPCDVIPE